VQTEACPLCMSPAAGTAVELNVDARLTG
jgi:hypothetical protein